jgi:hypothetical protein
MTKSTMMDLKKRALMAVRDYGVNLTLFRNAMSEWAGLNVTDNWKSFLMSLNDLQNYGTRNVRRYEEISRGESRHISGRRMPSANRQ